jgi:hypothetical protein
MMPPMGAGGEHMGGSQVTTGVSAALPAGLPRGNATPGMGAGVAQLAPQTLLQRCLSFPAMLGAILVAAAATTARIFILDPDVWWHIKQGADILATHHVPRVDAYSLTLSGHAWTAYEWMGDALLAATYRLGGLSATELLSIVLSGAIMLSLYALATLRSGNSKAGFVAAAMLFVPAAASFNLRPQMLGYLFLILTLIFLERLRQGKPGTVWLLPVMMLIWVNTHGSWIIGLGTIGVYLAAGLFRYKLGDIEAVRWDPSDRLRMVCVFLLCSVSTVITPYGTQLAKYPFQVASSLPIGIANVEEWQSMPFNESLGKYFLVLLLGFVLLQIAFRFTWRLEEFGLFLLGTAMACIHARFLLLFVPFLAPLLATTLARWLPRYERHKDLYALNAALMAVVLTVILWLFPSQASLERTVASKFPVGAVSYLDQHPVAGPMYNSYFFGGYLVWARAPQHKVFLDGRSELYERGGLLGDFLEISSIKPDALAVMQKYGIQSCLLVRDEPLATVLAALPDWERVYEDQTSVLFVRRGNLAASSTETAGAETAAAGSAQGNRL